MSTPLVRGLLHRKSVAYLDIAVTASSARDQTTHGCDQMREGLRRDVQ